MIDGTRPRDWSPNWGVAAFLVACCFSATAGRLFKERMWSVGCAFECATILGCAFILGRLAPSARRNWGTLGVPLIVALVVADVLTPEASSGWAAHVAATLAAGLAVYVPLRVWLARCDRRRLAP